MSEESVDMNGTPIEKPAARDPKQVQNLTAALILVAGLFIGSLFVDVAQLFRREGFSPRAVRENNVLEVAGKTWVAYPDPKVRVEVITDSSCEDCAPDEALVWFRRVLPTMEAVPVEAESDRGRELVGKFGVKTIPAFIFSGEVTGTDFYGIASEIFTETDGSYRLDTAQLGLTPGKYLSYPEVGEGSIVIGSAEAAVKVIEFSDFQCPYSRAFHATIKQMLAEYGDRIAFVYKHLPLSFHPQAQNAALASECANEQGKFLSYADLLFDRQAEWGATEGTQRFKEYARRLGLKPADFNACMDSKKYADKIAADMAEAATFGIDGTPGTFVGDTLLSGALPYEQVKSALEGQLASE